jgi:hypothetical protein
LKKAASAAFFFWFFSSRPFLILLNNAEGHRGQANFYLLAAPKEIWPSEDGHTVIRKLLTRN